MTDAPTHTPARLRLGRLRRKTARASQGAPPGSLVVDPDAPRAQVEVMAFDGKELLETTVEDLDQLAAIRDEWKLVWLNIDGLDDVETVRAVGGHFDLHPLALEDVVHAHQRPKVEEYRNFLFIVARMAHLPAGELFIEQLGMFLGAGWVVTFQEGAGDPLDPVRQRIRDNVGKIRTSGADYLAYALLDAVVDAYFPVLDEYGDCLELIEKQILEGDGDDLFEDLHDIRNELMKLRRSSWMMRDMVSALQREGVPFITDDTKVYLRDVQDHGIRITENIEIYREMTHSLRDLHFSIINARMNEVMKVLTIIATIFIPLSFVAGLYGMNFNPEVSPFNMPELNWYLGYPFALSIMAVMSIGMLIYFRRKEWF